MISEVYNEDNMLMMARYTDKFFDLAIVDPPYGIGESRRKNRTGTQSLKKGLKPAKYATKSWDDEIPSEAYFLELFRVSKNQIIFGGNYFIKYLENTPCFIVWDKKGTDGSDFADCELAWTSFKSSVKKFSYPWIGFGYLNNPQKEKKVHPTQKPVQLYKWILEKYAQPGDKILDTHLGSGSSRIAAYDLGFDFYGCELDKDYFDASCKRFDTHIAQQRLFTPDNSIVAANKNDQQLLFQEATS